MPPKIKQNNPAPPLPVFRRRRQKFTLEEKLSAVATMLRFGGLTIEGIAYARQAINSNPSDRALAAWLSLYRDRVIAAQHDLVPVPKSDRVIVAESDVKIEETLSKLQSKLLSAMDSDEKINSAQLRDLAVTMGIVSDKLRLATGLSPEMTAAIKELAAVCAEKRIDPVQAVKDLTEDARRYVPPPVIAPSVDDAITLEEIP